MKLLLENWKKYLNEGVFYANINQLVPTEEIGHGKEHHCPGTECAEIIQQKMDLIKNGDFEPIEVCNHKSINSYHLQNNMDIMLFLLVIPIKDNIKQPFYFVLNGHHRLEAAKRLEMQKVPIFLTKGEDEINI